MAANVKVTGKNDYRGAGVYVFRTRRTGLIGMLPPGLGAAAMFCSLPLLYLQGYPLWPALLGLLLTSRQFAYVGETTAMQLRKDQHLIGGGRYNTVAKPWADLAPSHYFLALPGAPGWVLEKLETLLIMLFWPVYNDAKNRWNPRRIPLETAKRQRARRDKAGWSFNCRPVHVLALTAAGALIVGRL